MLFPGICVYVEGTEGFLQSGSSHLLVLIKKIKNKKSSKNDPLFSDGPKRTSVPAAIKSAFHRLAFTPILHCKSKVRRSKLHLNHLNSERGVV